MINLVCIVDDVGWDSSKERFRELLLCDEVIHIDVDLMEHE